MTNQYVNTDSDEAVKLWEKEKLFRDVIKETGLKNFIASDGNGIIHQKRITEGQKGDRVRFALMYDINQGFLNSRQLIRGNEGNILTATDQVIVDEANLGQITGTDIDRQRAMYDQKSETRMSVVRSSSMALYQKYMTEMFNATYTTNYIYSVAGAVTSTTTKATAKTAANASYKFTPAFASAVKRWSITNRDDGRVPITPIMVDGKKMFVWFVSHDVGQDIKYNETWAKAAREALQRGKDNPLFTGAVAVWDGMIFFEDEYVTDQNETNAGAGADVASSEILFCGAQALLYGTVGTPELVSEDISYGQQMGIAYKSICGVKKTNFSKAGTAKQFGSLNILIARTNITG